MGTICYLVRPCSGGMQKHVDELLGHFRQSYRLILVAPRGNLLVEKARQMDIDVHELPLSENITPLKDLYALRQLVVILRRERPRLLHAHGFKAGLWGRLAGRIMGIPVVVTVHNYPAYPVRGLVLPHLFRAVENAHGHWACRYITVSKALAGYLLKNTTIDEEKIEVIHNGINTAPFEQALQTNMPAARTCLDFIKKEGTVLVGTVARLAPQKGIRHLIQAAAILSGRHPHLRFVIIGDGPMRGYLENLVQRLEMQGKVFFTGQMEDVPSLMAMLDIFVLPSCSEGLSLTVMEALAALRPVVASHTGGVPEIISHDRTGKLVRPGDSHALARAIEELISDPDTAGRMAARGQARVKALFSREEMFRRTGRLYRKFMDTPASTEVSNVR
ncbi:MAG: glycosyltransferase family 4 protein [Firmicutes bacterium]|nr:glycosyltransferase family 4 protein [Bacillota bacterium]